jgi:hypothetical protein
MKMVGSAGLEPATSCLLGVNQQCAAECDGQLRRSVFFTFRGLNRSPKFLLSAMVFYLAVHQTVHQICPCVGSVSRICYWSAEENRAAGCPVRFVGHPASLRAVLTSFCQLH